jgi:hypothetical protein
MLSIKALVDITIDDNPHAPFIWVPAEDWQEFCRAIDQRPNLIGAVIYRGKTIREGPPNSEITTYRY